MSYYQAKPDLKNATSVDISELPKKIDLANLKSDDNELDINTVRNKTLGLSNLKSKVDKLDFDKLIPVPVDLSKLSDVVKYDVKKTQSDELVININVI